MAATDTITMTMHEVDRFKVVQSVVDGRLMPWRAAEIGPKVHAGWFPVDVSAPAITSCRPAWRIVR